MGPGGDCRSGGGVGGSVGPDGDCRSGGDR